MNDSRFVVTLFCDDLRQEVGNKYSLIGCYGGELIVHKLPVVLPKLCAQVRVLTPIDKPFAALAIRALLNDENIAELRVTREQLKKAFEQKSPAPESRRYELIVMLVMSPISIPEPGVIRIEVETESESIKGGVLAIRERTPQDDALFV